MLSSIQMTRKEKKQKKARIYSTIPFSTHKELQSETASFNQLQVLHKLHRGGDATDESSSVPLTAWRVLQRWRSINPK